MFQHGQREHRYFNGNFLPLEYRVAVQNRCGRRERLQFQLHAPVIGGDNGPANGGFTSLLSREMRPSFSSSSSSWDSAMISLGPGGLVCCSRLRWPLGEIAGPAPCCGHLGRWSPWTEAARWCRTRGSYRTCRARFISQAMLAIIQRQETRPGEREEDVRWSSSYMEISLDFFEESSEYCKSKKNSGSQRSKLLLSTVLIWFDRKIREIRQRTSKPERGTVLAYILPAIFPFIFADFSQESIAEFCDEYSSVVSFFVSNYLNFLFK
jgi:hypothetical protein